MSKPLLEVKNLKKYFNVPKGTLHAVDDISFSIDKGKTLGIVGESGCGKTTAGRAILRLVEPTSGQVIFDGVDVLALGKSEMRHIRRNMQLIFQDPFSSLNPRKTITQTIEEPLILANMFPDKDQRFMRVMELMETVGLAERLVNTYPHELDGGRRQRICIARALAMSPKFIVCDEPVSALDVSIQAQVLNLFMDLQQEFNTAYVFISHNLAVVQHVADDVMVMYL
ncbi:MAG: dipeptide/oligopeptide/nickel ABC transporter ATP-binding protein, partial [Oscillospiraceae bacterium]